MSTMRWLALGAMVAIAGCGKKEPSGPVGGDLTVSYGGSGLNDGALLVVVNGPVTSITALKGYHMSSASAGVNKTRVVLTGTLVGGDILRLTVPDVSALASYTVQVEAAADRTTFALADPSGYSATVRK